MSKLQMLRGVQGCPFVAHKFLWIALNYRYAIFDLVLPFYINNFVSRFSSFLDDISECSSYVKRRILLMLGIWLSSCVLVSIKIHILVWIVHSLTNTYLSMDNIRKNFTNFPCFRHSSTIWFIPINSLNMSPSSMKNIISRPLILFPSLLLLNVEFIINICSMDLCWRRELNCKLGNNAFT